MSEQKNLIIHIGVHKNATTHLQQVLHSNRDLIEAEQRRIYLPRDLRPKLGEHLYAIAMGDNVAEHQARLRDLFDLASENDVIKSRLIFDENICGRIKPLEQKIYPMLVARLSALLDVFDNHTIKVYVCLRSYADFYRSSYLEYIRTSKHITFDEYLGEFDYRSYGWGNVFEDLLTLVRPEQLCVYRYDQYRDVLAEVVSRLSGVPAEEMNLQPGERVYQSLSNKAIEIVENSKHVLTRDERVKALNALEAVFPKSESEDPRSYWSEQDENFLNEKFEADYSRLKRDFAATDFIG